jgi:hypothetical protein
MQLRLKQLRSAVKVVLEEQKTNDVLRSEVKRVLGPTSLVNADTASVARAAITSLDAKALKNESTAQFKLAALLRFAEHSEPAVRQLAAKLLPKKCIKRLLEDKDVDVRFTAAKRLSSVEVKKLMERLDDDELLDLYESKVLSEEREKSETKLTGDVVKTSQGTELSDHYYDTLAARFLQDYGTCLFTNWKLVASRYVSSVKATSLVDIDKDKLLKAIEDSVEARDEQMYDPIKETIKTLKGTLEPLEESRDPLFDLTEKKMSSADYIEQFESLYDVRSKEVNVKLLESMSSLNVPVEATSYNGHAIAELDEQALDKYVSCWNNRQRLLGSNVNIEWYINADDATKVSFVAIT